MKYRCALTFFSLLFVSTSLFSTEIYDLVRIPIQSDQQWKRLSQLGIALEEGVQIHRESIEMILSRSEIEKLRKEGFESFPLKKDMEEFFRTRLKGGPAPPFASGSMGGNLTFDQVVIRFNQLRSRYPTILSRPVEIGSSVEGRPILAYRISDNADRNEPNEPQVLYTALHHAREPQSMMTVVYFIEKILTGYRKNPEITYLIDNREMWFIPVVNPDGYVYNQQLSPQGGGMWRKNRRNNQNGSFGVDLNRNYGFKWGADNSGSSPNTNDETYRGASPFSEPETSAVRDFVESKKFQLALNYHSFRDLWIYPWGFKPAETAHRRIFRELARKMTEVNRYHAGTVFETLRYLTNGEADDWHYGEIRTKNRIFAMTPEIGGFQDGFWPARNRILRLAQENYTANLTLAWAAGGYPTVFTTTLTEIKGNGNRTVGPGEDARLSISFRNMGVREKLTGLKATITAQSCTVLTPSITIGNIAPLRDAVRTADLRFASTAPRNRQLPVRITISSNDTILRTETVYVVLR